MPPSEHQLSVVVVPDKAQEQPKMTVASWCATHWQPLLAEFLATALLLLFGCMSTIPVPGISEQSGMYVPLCFGTTVMVLIQSFGHISGAHINPVVTVIAVIWGSMSIPTAIAYFVMQTIGAIAGYGIMISFSPVNVTEGAICLTLPHNDITNFQAIGIEVVITAILGFLCCAVWDPRNSEKQDSVPLKFGLTITGMSLAAGPLTGASLNPVRSLAPALWTGIWRAHYVYWVGPFCGGLLSVLIYKLLFREKLQKQ